MNPQASFASSHSGFLLQKSRRGTSGTNIQLCGGDGSVTGRMWVTPFAVAVVLTLAAEVPSVSALDDHNPIGVTGAFEGVIATGCAYNVLNHNATRGPIDDIVVAGAIGKYGLKMSRYYNSRHTANYLAMGPGWSHEYLWTSGNDKVQYPNGNVWDSHCTGDWGLGGPLGVSDWTTTWYGSPAFRMADGGTVVFENPNFGVATKIIDPYGQITTVTLDNLGVITRVTEPGGRYLQFFYYPSSGLLKQVEAYDGISGHSRLDWVAYHYTQIRPAGGGTQGNPMNCLTSVDYSDGQHAYYSYEDDNVPDHPQYGSAKIFPLISTCNDVRYHGPMSRIAYVYQDQGPHGAILEEKYSPSDGIKGVRVSKIDPPAPSPITETPNFDTIYTETRGDGPSRSFTYTDLHLTRSHGDPEACPIAFRGPAPQQFLLNYTDFENHTTQLHYDANWYVDSVTDANNHTTSYIRGPPPNANPGPKGIGEIKKITYQDGTQIEYGYYSESGISGHYLTSIIEYTPSNQRKSQTIQYRDDTTHKIYRIDYMDGNNNILAHETFTYCDDADSQCGPPNPTTGQMHGQIKTHRLKNGAYVHYKYDSQGRGLLADQWEPTWNDSVSESDPKTHYDYYTSGLWRDRLKTKTLPSNYPYGYTATETYEYDKDVAGNPMSGRGLVTKITYTDPDNGPYRSFGYDVNGNKRWEEDELRNRTSYGYDEYNRLTIVTRPLNGITNYTYNPANGNGSRLSHTTSNPDTITSRTSATTNVVTKNDYDDNFRKISSTVAFGTASAATTWFHFDSVGNEDYVTDPRGSESGDSQYTTYTDHDSRNRKWRVREPLDRTTEFHYDDGFNITRTVRPDNTTETKVYDSLNRVMADTVPKAQGINIVTQFQYYPWNVRSAGLLKKVIDGENHTSEFEYDPAGLTTKMTYEDDSTQSWVYDAAHNLQSRKTVAGEIQNFGYDERNRKVGDWWDGFPADGEWRVFDYDDAGHLVLATNGIGDWWSNFIADVRRSYDDAGRLTTDQQTVYVNGVPNTKVVSYPSYYDDGKLHRLYVNGITGYDYSFGYDEMRRLEFIFPSGDPNALFQYSYDVASNETQRCNWSNQVAQNYVPDELNRITSVEIRRTNTNTQLGLEVYDYYTIGRLHTVTREDNTQDQFVYYLDGEMKQATYGVSATPPPSPTPRPTATPTPPPGQVAEPSFNPQGRNVYPNTSVTVTISTATTGAQIRYSLNGGNTWITIANHGTATFSVGLAGKTLKAIGFKSGIADSDPHEDYYWREDPGGGRGPMAPETDGIIPYPLDTGRNGLGQELMAPTVSVVTYTLNKTGNRLSANGTSYSPNGINQYTTAGGDPVTNGNDHEIQTYRGFTYTYMRDQELQKVTAPGFAYELAYDALGRCVRRTANSDPRYPMYYVYDGDKPILEFRANGQIVRNLYGKSTDEMLMRTDPAVNGSQPFYFQQDHEGSVTHLTNWNNGSGQIIERYRYDTFGTPTIYAPNWTRRNTSSYNNRFLFTGREYAGAWVYEYRARVYHSDIGRFMSEDPKLFEAGDYNLFRYCHNDPIDNVDPMGLADQQLPPGPTHLTQAIAMDITISERISLWQRSMETSIGGEQAFQMLQSPQFKDNLTRQLGGTNSALEQSPRFRAFMPFIFRWEGGYSDDRHDPGGETNFGIDARSHPGVDIRHLTKDGAEHIYWSEWGNSRAEGLHYPLGEVHFNAYVNTGSGQAATFLRRSGGDALSYINTQEAFYRKLARDKPNFERYLRGWINRSENLKTFLNVGD